jgi:hypothetical protein
MEALNVVEVGANSHQKNPSPALKRPAMGTSISATATLRRCGIPDVQDFDPLFGSEQGSLMAG